MAGRIVELVFRGDNRSAVRALSGIATASDKTNRKLKKDTHESSAAFGAMGAASGRLRGAVGGLAGAAGVGGLAFGIKGVVQAGMEWQAQQAQLRGALRNTSQYSKSTLDSLNESASRVAAHGGFAASENVHALTQLVTATGSVAKAQRDMSLATDVARRTGRDYTTIVKAIALAENGHTTALTRLGIALPKVTKAQDALAKVRADSKNGLQELIASGVKLTAAEKARYEVTHQVTPEMAAQAKAQDQLASSQGVIAQLQQKYSGAASAYSRTTAGQASNLRNQFKELQERIGAGLLPVITRLVSGLSTTVGWLNKHRAVMYAILGVTGAVTAILTAHAIALEVGKAKTLAFAGAQRLLGIASGEAATAEKGATIATIAWGDAFKLTIIGAIITGLVLLITHFKTVERVVSKVWHAITAAAAAAWQWIKGHWPLIAGILLAPFIGPVGIIVALFHKQIIGAVQAVWHFIERAASAIFNALTWPFRKAAGIIKGFWHGAGSVLHTASFGLLNTGGVVKPKYLAGGGPVGMDTVPGWLTPGEGVVNRRGMGVLGAGGLSALNAGHAPGAGGNVTIEPGVVQLRVDGRVLAEAVVRYTLRRAARGPSSLVGGSLLAGPAHAA